MEKIISKENKKIKLLKSLNKANKRKREGKFLIEGKKEIEMALESDIQILDICYCSEYGNEFDLGVSGFEVTKEKFDKLSYRENPDGFLAIAELPKIDLQNIKLKECPLVLVIEKVEKPGNIGAMLRTADAVGVDAVILCEAQTDFYNPNVIRSSLGAVFSVQVASGSNKEVLDWLMKNKMNIYSAYIEDSSIDFTQVDFKKGTAIVIGTEHKGLSKFWSDNATENIKIPMQGKIDSLNASVSAAVLMYEAFKQRNS